MIVMLVVKIQISDDHYSLSSLFGSLFSTFLAFFFSGDSSIRTEILESSFATNDTDLFVVQPGAHFGSGVTPGGYFFASLTISTCSIGIIGSSFGGWGRGIHVGATSTEGLSAHSKVTGP